MRRIGVIGSPIVLVLALALIGVISPATPASADTNGFISGNVTDASTGLPIGNVQVNAYEPTFGTYIVGARTMSNGGYNLNLIAGSYVVQARPSDTGRPYANEYYGGAYARQRAQVVSVAAGATTPSIDISVDPASFISGNITAGATPLASVNVNAYEPLTGWQIANTTTNALGVYTLNVPSGNFTVQARPSDRGQPYVNEYYGGVYFREQTRPVSVAASATVPNIDINVDPAGFISGNIAAGSDPLNRVSVSAVDLTSGLTVASASTNVSGGYTLNVPNGSYVVQANPPGIGLPYAREYYGGVYSRELARPVSVAVGSTTPNIDIRVDPAGFISGNIAAGSTPLAGVSVSASDNASGLSIGSTNTRWDGSYTLVLPPGSYTVQAQPAGIGLAYANEYYGGVYARDFARPVSVAVGNTTPGIDISVNPAGSISGKVTSGATPLAGVSVSASDDASGLFTNSVRTGWDGNYTLILPPGSYTMQAQPAGIGLSYANEYYGGVYSRELATPVAVTAGGVATNKDISVDPAGFISGKVTADTTALAGVNVYASDNTSGIGVNGVRTGWDGSYTLALPPGSYVVQAQPAGIGLAYANEYYGGVYSRELATPVAVTAGNTASNKDISVDPAGFIAGRVTVGSSNPGYISVSVQDANSYLGMGSVRTRWDGTYTVNVPPGNYIIKVRPDMSGLPYAAGYYGGAYASQYASQISVAAGATITGIDFAPATAGLVNGQVTGPGGVPLPYVSVIAVEPAFLWQYADTRTRWDGTYTLTLPTGSYNLQVRPNQTRLPYTDQWFNHAFRNDQAALVTVTAPSNQSGFNFALEPGAAISGRVIATSSGLPIAGATVNAYLYSSLSIPSGQLEYGSSANVKTDFNGYYRVTVPAGVYTVRTNLTGYATEWYSNNYVANMKVQSVTVSTGELGGIDFSLEPGYSISGHVYGADGTTPISGASIGTNFSGQTPAGPGGLGGATSGTDGRYRVDGLPAGTIMVRAWKTGYNMQYYSNRHFWDRADNITLGATPPPSIDFRLSPDAGSISGFVYEADGTTPIFVYEADGVTPVSQRGIQVYVSDGGAWILAYRAKTLPDGSYLVPSVKSGLSYRVYSAPSGYVPQWFKLKANDTDADPVPVLPLSSTTNVTFVMARQGEVPYQTPVGENATVSDQYLGITMNYATVTAGGTTGFLTSSQAPAPAAGYSTNSTYYDIVTQATYSGNITMSITYRDSDVPAGESEADLKLWHWTGSTWEDVTVSVDTLNNIITGRVISLSPFSWGIPWKVKWEPPLANRTAYVAQVGSTVPIKFQFTDAKGKNVNNVDVMIIVTRDRDGATVLSEKARLNGNHYQVNASTESWALGDYTVRLSVNKDAGFKLSLVQAPAKGKDK